MKKQLDQRIHFFLHTEPSSWPVLICVLGNFSLLRSGNQVAVHNRGKLESLLAYLGLHAGRRVPREQLLTLLWPTSPLEQAGPALNNLVYRLHKLLGDVLNDAKPVLHEDGYYRLNSEAGVGVDIECFDALVSEGAQHTDDREAALIYYSRALELYRGDLCVTSDIHSIVERERLRNRYLALLAEFADAQYHIGEYAVCLDYAWRLLRDDPCREDAHRLIMRCYVQLRQRAAALRHYQVCVDILHADFDASPEAATTELFDQIRLQPASM